MADITLTQSYLQTHLNVQPRKMSTADTVKSSTALTTAYTGFTTDWVPCERFRSGTVYLTWTVADATTMEVQIDISSDDGTTAFPLHDLPTPSAGATTGDILTMTFTAADYTTTAYIPVHLDLSNVTRFRVRAKKTGGSGTVNLVAKFIGGL